MLTTRESISYQFSLIFGYSSPNENLITGDVIGPGKLTKERVKELAIEVIKFLNMYNAILRDYTGSEVFSIEFSLINVDDKDAQINIYPKSMIFIPGKYKDCESLILAFKPETGVLNTHKSREDLIKISGIFYEIEEFSEHPELNKKEKGEVISSFASRFSMKLYGDLIEDKWNKKLIGLSTYLPTEKEYINIYAEIISKLDIHLYKKPYKIVFLNQKFNKRGTVFKSQSAIDHLKFSISEPSANFVIENTLRLGSNLINLANTGTIDESQEKIIQYLIISIEDEIKNLERKCDEAYLISKINSILSNFEIFFNKFFEYSVKFLNSGESGNLNNILDKFHQYIIEKGKLENENFNDLSKLLSNSVKNSVIKTENLRAIDLESIFYYFSEIFKLSIKHIKNTLPRFLSQRKLILLIEHFIKIINEEFEKEQKPVKILGTKLMEKFKLFLFNKIELIPAIISKESKYNEESLVKEYTNLIKDNYNSFLDNIELNINDLVSFAEVLMEKDSKIIINHIERFQKFPNELDYLLSYILRYSTINRFLKEEPDEEISDPVTFANRFHRFLEKRVGGIRLQWKDYILEWITDYGKRFFNLEENKKWDLKEINDDFVNYLEQRKFEEIKPEKFIEFLDKYITKIGIDQEKIHLMDFFKQYEFCVQIKNEFLKYIKNIIESRFINSKKLYQDEFPLNFLKIDENQTFYKYLSEKELKYYSKLIPLPASLILKHNLTDEEKELFNAELFHVLNFNYWGKKNVKIEIADNFKEVYREWVKEI